jgi:hypothetical protein
MNLTWGSYAGNLRHLFPGTVCVQSVCGKAYCGEVGLYRKSKRSLCALCVKYAKENGIKLP